MNVVAVNIIRIH